MVRLLEKDGAFVLCCVGGALTCSCVVFTVYVCACGQDGEDVPRAFTILVRCISGPYQGRNFCMDIDKVTMRLRCFDLH